MILVRITLAAPPRILYQHFYGSNPFIVTVRYHCDSCFLWATRGWGEMCVQYIGEMHLQSAYCGRISPVPHGRFHTVGVATQALLRLVVGVGAWTA